MGQTLSAPMTEKHSKSGGNSQFVYGMSEMQGWRVSMEDAHAIELKLEDDVDESPSFFAVYDGHGGGTIAKFSGEHVHKRLLKEETFRNKEFESALKKAFLGTDEDIKADPNFFRDLSGCTAVAALVTNDQRIFVANAGDSRSVLSVKGVAKDLSHDHKPMNATEMTRICNAGGYIEYGRVNGNLSLSRAIGDFQFKTNQKLKPEDQIITADPDVSEHSITDDDEFLILACDGIWDCLTSQQCVDVVRRKIAEREELPKICEFVLSHCLAPDTTSGAGVGCDNMTIMIIGLLRGKTTEEWYDCIADRVEKGYGYKTPTELPVIYSPDRANGKAIRRPGVGGFRWAGVTLSASGDDSPGADGSKAGGGTEDDDDDDEKMPFNYGRSRFLGGGSGQDVDMTGPGGGSILTFSNAPSANSSKAGGAQDDDDEEERPFSAAEFTSYLASLRQRTAVDLHPDITRALRAELDALEESDPSPRRATLHDEDDDEEDNHDHPRLGNAPSGGVFSHAQLFDPDDEAHQAFGTGIKYTLWHDPEDENSLTQPRTDEPESPSQASLPNGDVSNSKQLRTEPGGDEVPAVAQVEGLLDKSEDPTKS